MILRSVEIVDVMWIWSSGHLLSIYKSVNAILNQTMSLLLSAVTYEWM